MTWVKSLKKWNCAGFAENCEKREKIAQFIFLSKEHDLHESAPMHAHHKNEKRLEEISAYQNLIIEREAQMLSFGYFTREEIIGRRSKEIQQILNLVVSINESIYENRTKNNIELALGFWSYTKIDYSILNKDWVSALG